MASILGHGITGFTISKITSKSNIKVLIILAILSSILPDIDVFAFHFGIPYESPLGHRGFTHSVLFAATWAVVLTFIFGKAYKKLFLLVIFFSTVSHGILDAMTNGGRGVGFLIPFDNERYFFPFRVIKVSPLKIGHFFSEWGWQVILSEFKFVVIPCVIVLVILYLIKKNQ